MRLLIKNMVSFRCKMIVRSELERLGLHFTVVELGEVEISEELTPATREHLHSSLKKFGLELMEDKKGILIERIKNVVVDWIQYNHDSPDIKFSVYMGKQLNQDYKHISKLFSEVKGITIEHYIIIHKIERAKELLIYDDLHLTEIAFRLNYNSVAHLSNQFRQITGLTPSFFKKMKLERLASNR